MFFSYLIFNNFQTLIQIQISNFNSNFMFVFDLRENEEGEIVVMCQELNRVGELVRSSAPKV